MDAPPANVSPSHEWRNGRSEQFCERGQEVPSSSGVGAIRQFDPVLLVPWMIDPAVLRLAANYLCPYTGSVQP